VQATNLSALILFEVANVGERNFSSLLTGLDCGWVVSRNEIKGECGQSPQEDIRGGGQPKRSRGRLVQEEIFKQEIKSP
jgi:hypothetical protein